MTDGSLTFAIGDIHGEYEKLERLLNLCGEYAGDHERRFVFLGNYVDHGQDSAKVVQLLMEAEYMFGAVCLKGNHEALLTAVATTGFEEAYDHWQIHARGYATTNSYGVGPPWDIPTDHIDWMRSRPLLWQDSMRLFVHAGVVPGLPIERQGPDDLLWIREPFLSSKENYGLLVVHGHTPTDNHRPELYHNRLNIDTGATFGGPLTAAVFCDSVREPIAYLYDYGHVEKLGPEPRTENSSYTENDVDKSVPP